MRFSSTTICVLPIGVIVAFAAGCTQKLPNYPPAYREYAYVTNGKSNTVSVLDMRNYKAIATIAVGINPTGVTANSQKNEIYVVNAGSNSLSVIDAEQNKVVATIGLEQNPYFVDVSPDGTRAYVGNAKSNSVSVLDLGGRRVLKNVAVGRSPGIVRVSSDGKTVLAVERLGNSVSVLDAQMNVRSSVPVCLEPTYAEILPDSEKAFVTCSGSAQIAVIALNASSGNDKPQTTRAESGLRLTRKTEARAGRDPRTFGPDRLLALLDVGATPVHLALKPDGGEVFVTNFDANTISEVVTNTNEVAATHLIGAGPVRGVISADNSTLYVSNFNSDTIGVYSIDDGKLVETVHVGSRPDALALSPNQNFLFVADTAAGDVSVVRTAARQGAVLLTIIPVGQQPNAIAVKAFILRKPPTV